GDTSFTFGLAGDRVVTGDWNGDGRTDVGVVRALPNGAALFTLDSNGNFQSDASDKSFIFGAAGDKFLVGDWTGDGRAKVGVVRPDPATGLAVFSLDNDGNGSFGPGDSVFRFGLASDTFVIGDWAGSGQSGIGVVRDDGQGLAVFSLDS